MSVRDSGKGIPEDKRQMVFEEFSQADLSTTRTHGGTGLGLSIVRRLASLMGGTVTLRSGDRARLPIVALTAHAVGGHEAACREAGMDDFLTKPFKPAALYELIDRLLGGGAPGQPSASMARKTAG